MLKVLFPTTYVRNLVILNMHIISILVLFALWKKLLGVQGVAQPTTYLSWNKWIFEEDVMTNWKKEFKVNWQQENDDVKWLFSACF